ncbi:MAG: hypothetical protein FJ090_04985 [Deltaproteobacteria bacterium]|nr:hypothetical protein [Deltaproteobacteria bacterium]
MEYHGVVDDPRAELATLVADTVSLVQSLRLQGVIGVPVESRREASPGSEEEVRAQRELTPTRTAPSLPTPSLPAAVVPMPPSPSPAPLAMAAPALLSRPLPSEGEGLLGKWKARAQGPEERLAAAVAALPEHCEGCGEPTLAGRGGLRSSLVLLAPAARGEASTMLSNMLLKVLSVEPGDAWTAAPRACASCIGALARQVEAIKPRVVLALGPEGGSGLGLVERGRWGRWAGADAIWTWHPEEILADATRKRAAFEVLKEVANRR